VRLGLDPLSEGVRVTLDRRIQIRRSRLSFLSDLMQRAGSKMSGSDLKRGANRYGQRSAAGSRSKGHGSMRLRSNLIRGFQIGRPGTEGGAGWRCCSPERGLRGGASPVTTKLGRPGFVWLGIKPWRKLAVRVIHLGYQRGGSGLGWAIPAARAARGGAHAGVRAFQGLGGIPGFGI
jgi:hypothetical protein